MRKSWPFRLLRKLVDTVDRYNYPGNWVARRYASNRMIQSMQRFDNRLYSGLFGPDALKERQENWRALYPQKAEVTPEPQRVQDAALAQRPEQGRETTAAQRPTSIRPPRIPPFGEPGLSL